MAAAADDLDAWVASDLRFHQAIYAATDNEFFWPVGLLLEPAFAVGLRVTGMAQHQQQCIPEHRAVRDAIIARDPAWAHQAVVELMRTSEADLWQALGSATDAG
jgi:DNA-binding FadR family transcriptional regulator